MEILQSHFEVEIKGKGWFKAVSIWVEGMPETCRTFYKDKQNKLIEFWESDIVS